MFQAVASAEWGLNSLLQQVQAVTPGQVEQLVASHRGQVLTRAGHVEKDVIHENFP